MVQPVHDTVETQVEFDLQAEVGADDSDDEQLARERVEASAPDLDIAADDDLSPQQHLRLLMRLLHQAIADHITNGDLLPSDDLERAMFNAKCELDWN